MDKGRLLDDGKSGQWQLLNNSNATLILWADPENWQAWATAQRQRRNAYQRQRKLILWLVGVVSRNILDGGVGGCWRSSVFALVLILTLVSIGC